MFCKIMITVNDNNYYIYSKCCAFGMIHKEQIVVVLGLMENVSETLKYQFSYIESLCKIGLTYKLLNFTMSFPYKTSLRTKA